MSFELEDNWADVPRVLGVNPLWRAEDKNNEGVIYHSDVDGHRWRIRLNDFPDEPMFSLIIDGAEVIHFNDWPSEWGRRPQSDWK
jgi:hypothetical protein